MRSNSRIGVYYFNLQVSLHVMSFEVERANEAVLIDLYTKLGRGSLIVKNVALISLEAL